MQQSSRTVVPVSVSLPFVPKHLSREWLEWLDAKAGKIMEENGGYFDLAAHFFGKPTPREYEVTERYLSYVPTAAHSKAGIA